MGADARGALLVLVLVAAVVGASVAPAGATTGTSTGTSTGGGVNIAGAGGGAESLGDAWADGERFRLEGAAGGSLAGAVVEATRTGRPVEASLLLGEGRSQEWERVTIYPDGRVTGRGGRVVQTAAQTAQMMARRGEGVETDAGGARA